MTSRIYLFTLSLHRNVGTWNSLKAERGWEKASNNSCQFSIFSSCQKEVMSSPGSLPLCQLPSYQGAIQFLKELLKTHFFPRAQWNNFYGIILGTVTSSVWNQYLLNTLIIQPNPPALKIILGDRKELRLESSRQSFSSQNHESPGWLA